MPHTRDSAAGNPGDSGFDAAWYHASFPDVALLGMAPETHFRRYGRLMGRAPNARAAQAGGGASATTRAPQTTPPRPGTELLAAHEIARRGDHEGALAFARGHVPESLGYTLATLRANAALARGDEDGWLHHLNRYLGHLGAAPVHLRAGGALLDRLATLPLPPVTGGPLVSVIMPVWNAAATLRAAAGSILAQSWRNLELLVIDDASGDGSWALLQEIAAGDDRVRLLRNPVNVGPYVSKNIALAGARGQWITGHDADDWAHPQRLEHHLRASAASPRPPRASLTFMLRLEPDGVMDRFAPVGDYSLDGIARDAAISCTFDAAFLRERLGGWDNVRFGADSELIARSRLLIGEEFARIPQIGMLCMNRPESLTNHPDYGVTRTAGPSRIRRDYSAAWGEWHRTAGPGRDGRIGLPFPPADARRPFPAPPAALVPLSDILRCHAVQTGRGSVAGTAVTAICVSKRPGFLHRVAQMLTAQTHRPLHVIHVAHGPGHDPEAARAAFAAMTSATILAEPDPEARLGDLLNLALAHCDTDVVAKIDDDDFYGPDYIRRSLAALHHSGHDRVGIVGRERAYCYVEEEDALALRYGPDHENRLRSRVFGGTIFWSRAALGDQRFISANTGEDSAFFRDAAAKGVRIFSAEATDYVHVRYAGAGAHTWRIDSREFLRPATILATGLRLDLAWGSRMEPVPVALPDRGGLVAGQA